MEGEASEKYAWRCLQHDQHILLFEFVLQLEVALHRPRLQAKTEIRAANLSEKITVVNQLGGRQRSYDDDDA